MMKKFVVMLVLLIGCLSVLGCAPKIRSIYIGDGYTFAVDTKNRLYGWGKNDKGQLGDGTTTDRTKPVPIQLPY